MGPSYNSQQWVKGFAFIAFANFYNCVSVIILSIFTD